MAPWTLPVKASIEIEPVPSGSHIAVCDMIVWLGIQAGSGKFPNPRPKVYLRFQLPNERYEFEKDGKKLTGPRVIGQDYTASMSKKANLRHLLASWRGRDFSDDEAVKFDIGTAIGRPCMLMVMHTKKKKRTYANISGIGPLPKGIDPKTIICEGTPLLYSPENTSTYQLLPGWLRNKIDDQILEEPAPEEGKPEPPPRGDAWDGSEPPNNDGLDSTMITDDDIPF